MRVTQAGQVHTRLTEERIELGRAVEFVSHEGLGAQLIFSGVVRSKNHGKDVVSVEYDAFQPLCEKVLKEICEEAIAEVWPAALATPHPARIALVHRVGSLKVGELSVLIAVATPHRDEAYRISRLVIENLKTRAPIWKRETYVEGRSEWLQGHALCSGNGAHL